MIEHSQQPDAQQREHPDPHESSTPIPRKLIALVSLALLWAVGYIFMAQSDDSPALGDRRTRADLLATAGSPAGTVDGAQIYAAQCAACHQATGAGLPGVFPPLAASEWVIGKNGLLVDIVLHGVSGKLTVKGASYNGAMPAFGEKLNDAEIAAVLSHIRTNFGNAAGKIDASLVKTARESGKERKTPWNGDDELDKLK